MRNVIPSSLMDCQKKTLKRAYCKTTEPNPASRSHPMRQGQMYIAISSDSEKFRSPERKIYPEGRKETARDVHYAKKIHYTTFPLVASPSLKVIGSVFC